MIFKNIMITGMPEEEREVSEMTSRFSELKEEKPDGRKQVVWDKRS